MPNLRLVNENDLGEFNIPASDTKGHSARLYFRCIPAMTRQIEQLLQSGSFPYKTKGDLLRHALHRHISWLNKLDPVTTIGGQVEAILDIMRDEEMHSDFVLIFNKLDERIRQHLDEDPEEATRLILVVQNHVNSMPDGVWKRKYRKKIREKYGGILKKANKANMATMEDD